MKRTDTQIHQIELLLTLDYLLNYTDENHPATQQDICRHAKDFGLKYDSKASSGNDVRRQRIGDCLQFLQHICYKFEDTDQIPFVINSTDSGKFYIEEKNHLNEEQIIKVLAAVQNDKYTKDEDTDLLINKLLDSLSNKHSREYYLKELEKENRRVKKFTSSVNSKLRLVNKAFKEKKSILIIQSHFGRVTYDNKDRASCVYNVVDKPGVKIGTIEDKVYCRVYRIEEHRNKPYAILIPINRPGIIFDAIQNLPIPNLPEREVLMEDETNDDRLGELFKTNNKYLSKYYGSLDEFIDQQIMPEEGLAFKSSFYFDYRYIDRVRKSFEEYFGKDMPVIKCNKFKVDRGAIHRGEALERPRKDDKFAIECEGYDGGYPRFGVVNLMINKNALVSWLYNNPNVADVVDVVSPASVNSLLGNRFLGMFLKYQDEVGKETVEKALTTGKYNRYKYARKK